MEEYFENEQIYEEDPVIHEIVDLPAIKVYIETDKDKNIIKVFSDAFEDPINSSILIDSGFGDKYRHAQSQYFDKPLMNEEFQFNYKYENGEIIEKK